MPTRDKQFEENFAEALHQRPRDERPAPLAHGMRLGKKVDPTLFLLSVARIRPDADQVRRMNKAADDAEVVELSASIRQIGLQNPVTVRFVEQDDIYELIA